MSVAEPIIIRAADSPIRKIFEELKSINLCRFWDKFIEYMGEAVEKIKRLKKCSSQETDFIRDMLKEIEQGPIELKHMKEIGFWRNLIEKHNKSFYDKMDDYMTTKEKTQGPRRASIKSCIEKDQFLSWARNDFSFKSVKESIISFVKKIDISSESFEDCIFSSESIEDFKDNPFKENTRGVSDTLIEFMYVPYAFGLYTLIVTTIAVDEIITDKDKDKYVDDAFDIIRAIEKEGEIPDNLKQIINRKISIYEVLRESEEGGTKKAWGGIIIFYIILIIMGVTGVVIYVSGFLVALILTLWDPEIKRMERPIQKIIGIMTRALESWYYVLMFIVYYRYVRRIKN